MENIDIIIHYAEDSKLSRFIDYKKHLRVCGLCGKLYGEHAANGLHKYHPTQKFHEHPQKTKLAMAFFVLIGGKFYDQKLQFDRSRYKISREDGTTPG
jgi:hypothetical protein